MKGKREIANGTLCSNDEIKIIGKAAAFGVSTAAASFKVGGEGANCFKRQLVRELHRFLAPDGEFGCGSEFAALGVTAAPQTKK